MFDSFKRFCVRFGAGASALLAGGYASASDLTAAAETAITSAGTDGQTVGGYVIAAVAGLVVVSLILAMIRKV